MPISENDLNADLKRYTNSLDEHLAYYKLNNFSLLTQPRLEYNIAELIMLGENCLRESVKYNIELHDTHISRFHYLRSTAKQCIRKIRLGEIPLGLGVKTYERSQGPSAYRAEVFSR